MTSSSEPTFTYIEPEELKEALVSQFSGGGDGAKSAQRFVVVDVRDDDFAGGNIRGAVNARSTSSVWQGDALNDFVEGHMTEKSTVVFHCKQSQVRGPACGNLFLIAASKLATEKGLPMPEVKVLRGGFHEFSERFSSDDAASLLFENK